MARVLIVGGGCRGRRLARELVGEGHAVRVSTRAEAGRAAIEASGRRVPDRHARPPGHAPRGSRWRDDRLLAAGSRPGESREQVRALHGSRLQFFLGQVIDTTVRGFVYETASASLPGEVLAEGERIVRAATSRNAIPVAFVRANPHDVDAWLADAQRRRRRAARRAAAITGLIL